MDVILYEDDYILVLNKFFGMVVYGGSGLSFGVIEGLWVLRLEVWFFELVYCFDWDILGVLLVVKKCLVLCFLYE